MYKHKHLIIFLIAVAVGVALMLFSPPALNQGDESNSSDAISASEDTEPVAWLITINGAIGPATSDYVTHNLETAASANARLFILAMDTPGGLDSSMREIIRAILDSPVPVVSFVSPQGARAASAGTYIMYASHIAAMSPATNLGAATPVQIGGGIGLPGPETPDSEQSAEGESVNSSDDQSVLSNADAMAHKSINDAAAYIRSLAELRGRNIEWAEQAVRQASSLPAHQALEMNVIDLMADDVEDLLQKIDGRQVVIQNQSIKLNTASIAIEQVEPDWRNRFLSTITDPNVAYILMLIGMYGLFLEFYNPGGIVPGVVGAISLLIAMYAFQVLPVNYAGLALIGLGVLLMVMEAFVPSVGILGTGGVISFVVGSVILMDTESDAFQIAMPLILSVALFSAIVLVLVVGMLIRARRAALVSGDSAMIGENAEVMEDFTEQGLVRVHGELWKAFTEKPVYKGQQVPIKAIKGLSLWLNNKRENNGDSS